jgi:hypothetical protein
LWYNVPKKLPAGDKVISRQQSSAPEDGRNYRPKHVELIEIANKLLLLRLVGCLYYCIGDARSLKHQTETVSDVGLIQSILVLSDIIFLYNKRVNQKFLHDDLYYYVVI